MTIVVVGASSFLAQKVIENDGARHWRFIDHKTALDNTEALQNATTVVNFAFPPLFFKEKYTPEKDFDLLLAKSMPQDCHFIALSSRMVYGTSKDMAVFKETSPCQPHNTYGQNKLAIEKALQNFLPADRLTILRLSNIFDFEPGRHTFFGAALKNLYREGKIFFDIDPQSPRDFLPRSVFAKYMVQIAKSPKAGIFNIGSGFGTYCGDIAAWLIEGYGQGELVVKEGSSNAGSFSLDMSKSESAYDLELPTIADIKNSCIECGRKLKTYAA